ncbi:molybdopterin-dependent oxidoreductase [Nostoc cf. edaphicum LEGE 07299]|uniref:Molybdopterin-dependent oxidoreductase n=1 Tax=Nostoc cf. edaphicum LEGE 07299 TaxID=2777974 RepID=A0ABR9TV17_9NOSO|nr:molybdopterin-dependent oxidoreductase [Nostoc edaphicum]MBE9103667.1 molybdopterin-dependent oxidoreductase [Nostoc cf. edaphicum LEGE 07299]
MTSKGRKKTSRRSFLQGVAISTAAVTGVELLKKDVADAADATSEGQCKEISSQSTEFDLTEKSAALQPDKIVNSACQFCNSLCRLKVHVKDGRIVDVLGEPDDPVQAGGFCIKGPMMTELVYNRFRLKYPMKRVAGEKGSTDSQFEQISWDEALSIIAGKFLALRDLGEARAIANKTSGRLPRGTGSLVGRYFNLLGSPNDTDVGPVCNDAGGNALAWTFGLGNFTNGYGIDGATKKEDLGSAKFLLFLGTNQAETHPVTFTYLLRSRAKTKAKLIVIDPRLTPTGAQADEWIAPKPHTDLALVLAMLYHIVTHNLYDAAFVHSWVLGFDELKQHLKSNNYTPEWAAQITDVPVSKIKFLAETYAQTKPAAIFCNAGISHQLNAFDTYRCLAFLAAITGNIGISGGGCNFMHNTWPGGLNLPPIEGKIPKKDIALPVGPDYFAEAIISGQPYRLKALITQGNPLLACSNTAKVQQAYRHLEFYVYTGLFMEESAYYADIILPVTSGFEMETVYMRRDDRAIRWQQQVVPPIGESKPDWHIWIELAHATAKLDKRNPPQYWQDNFPSSWKDYRHLWTTFVANTPGMAGMTQQRLSERSEPLRWPCPTVAHPGVSTLYLDHPSWYQAAESLDVKNKGKRFLTPSGKVEIYTSQLQKQLTKAGHSALPIFYTHPEVTGRNPTIEYLAELVKNPVNPHALTHNVKLGKLSTGEVHKQYPLMGTTGRSSVVHFHSVTHWTYTGKQKNGVRLVQIHPKTAQTAGIENGDEIIVESPRGSIKGTALLWQGIREDTIFVPNWFGSQQKMAQDLGTPYYEAANVLIDQKYYDNLSGQQAFKCFACRIKKA